MQAGCPCCSFRLEQQDLFLPPSIKEEEEEAADQSLSEPPSPQEAYERLKEHTSLLLDTHCHAHVGQTVDAKYTSTHCIPHLTCALHPNDWQASLEYCQDSQHRKPALGVHPWQFMHLPSDWLERLRQLLLEHPHCMVGEVGLCSVARVVRYHSKGKQEGLRLQRQVFRQQLQLATELQRHVSMHCVQCEKDLIQILKDQESLPPAISIHSFGGTAHQVQQLLQAAGTKTKLYFGISHYVNLSTGKSRQRHVKTIQTIPSDRLLAESDVSSPSDVALGTAAAVGYLAWALEKPLCIVAARTCANGREFLQVDDE